MANPVKAFVFHKIHKVNILKIYNPMKHFLSYITFSLSCFLLTSFFSSSFFSYSFSPLLIFQCPSCPSLLHHSSHPSLLSIGFTSLPSPFPLLLLYFFILLVYYAASGSFPSPACREVGYCATLETVALLQHCTSCIT